MKVYAFDVDETLEISNGPVSLQSMMELRVEGHIVGICGNWGGFVRSVKGWQHVVSFVNCAPPLFVEQMNKGLGLVRMDKAWFLQELQKYIPADEYVMVGNVYGAKNSLGFTCGSQDSEAAQIAGWRFIKEDDFAKGVR